MIKTLRSIFFAPRGVRLSWGGAGLGEGEYKKRGDYQQIVKLGRQTLGGRAKVPVIKARKNQEPAIRLKKGRRQEGEGREARRLCGVERGQRPLRFKIGRKTSRCFPRGANIQRIVPKKEGGLLQKHSLKKRGKKIQYWQGLPLLALGFFNISHENKGTGIPRLTLKTLKRKKG